MGAVCIFKKCIARYPKEECDDCGCGGHRVIALARRGEICLPHDSSRKYPITTNRYGDGLIRLGLAKHVGGSTIVAHPPSRIGTETMEG